MFGSYATGPATEYSDIDIALVSTSFTGNPFIDIELLLDAIVKVDSMLENHNFSPDLSENPFFQEIVRTGIRLR